MSQSSRAWTFTARDESLGADAAILAMDGKLLRADAERISRAVLESYGLTKRVSR